MQKLCTQRVRLGERMLRKLKPERPRAKAKAYLHTNSTSSGLQLKYPNICLLAKFTTPVTHTCNQFTPACVNITLAVGNSPPRMHMPTIAIVRYECYDKTPLQTCPDYIDHATLPLLNPARYPYCTCRHYVHIKSWHAPGKLLALHPSHHSHKSCNQ